MYAGLTLTNKSGAIFGVHQKIDRVSRRHLIKITNNAEGFPRIKDILHFEGKNGPDGIKRKSPAKDEPWHYYDPFDEEDSQLLELIRDHYGILVKELKKGVPEKAAFESAWMSHAIVDGLTPAHHFPYEKTLEELRGEGIETRLTVKDKLYIQGETPSDSLKKNWAVWGSKGLITSHFHFELGIAFLIAPITMKTAKPNETDIQSIIDLGYEEYFKRIARQIALSDFYERFLEKGWTPKLMRDVRNELTPTIIRTVTLVWFSAMRDAGLLKGKK